MASEFRRLLGNERRECRRRVLHCPIVNEIDELPTSRLHRIEASTHRKQEVCLPLAPCRAGSDGPFPYRVQRHKNFEPENCQQ
jgi:hypothetical protein